MGDPPPGVPGNRPRRPPPYEHPTEIFDSVPEDDFDELYEEDEYGDYDEDYDEDYEGEYDGYDDEYEDDEPADDERPGLRGRGRRRGRRRLLGWVAAVAVIALLAGGAWYGIDRIFGYADYDGDGQDDVVVQVQDGDTTGDIANMLVKADVVASTKAFVKAGAGDEDLTRVQHGYYVMKTKMSGASAVARITDPASKVGRLEIRAGMQFDDITQPDGKVTDGIYSLLSKASCAQLNGKSTCVPVADLRKVGSTADPATLGVPSWGVPAVGVAPLKERRLEGFIAPGVYDVKPGWSATELLSYVVKQSATQLLAAGLSDQTTVNGESPYQTLVIASIIEREAIQTDFGKISRVVYNRLATGMKLEMDSTVNYVLDQPTLLTRPEDRAKAGAYNTYQNTGLPPTPIGAPSREAIEAALQPTPGGWLFFVKCEKDGQSCFAVTNAEHEANKQKAQQNGVY